MLVVNVWLPLKILVTLLTKHPSGMLFIMINLKIISTLVPKEHQISGQNGEDFIPD